MSIRARFAIFVSEARLAANEARLRPPVLPAHRCTRAAEAPLRAAGRRRSSPRRAFVGSGHGVRAGAYAGIVMLVFGARQVVGRLQIHPESRSALWRTAWNRHSTASPFVRR